MDKPQSRADGKTGGPAPETIARLFSKLLEHSFDGVALLEPDGKVLDSALLSPRFLSFDREQLVGRNIFALIHPDDQRMMTGLLRELLATPGKRLTGTFRNRARDGSWRWLEGSAINLLDDPDVHAVVANYQDITEQRHVEDELTRQLAALSALNAAARQLVENLNLQQVAQQVVAASVHAGRHAFRPRRRRRLHAPHGLAGS